MSYYRNQLRRSVRSATPPPAPTPRAPVSGRVPAVGDEVEVVVRRAVLAARVPRLESAWVRDRVSELRFEEAAPGFTTAAHGARPRVAEEGTAWRWPAPAAGSVTR